MQGVMVPVALRGSAGRELTIGRMRVPVSSLCAARGFPRSDELDDEIPAVIVEWR